MNEPTTDVDRAAAAIDTIAALPNPLEFADAIKAAGAGQRFANIHAAIVALQRLASRLGEVTASPPTNIHGVTPSGYRRDG